MITDDNGAKRRKKFSVSDSQNTFAILAQSNQELDLQINLRKVQGRNIQPLLLVVGDTCKVKEMSIYFDGIRYPVLKVLSAIDILFKTFFVFSLQFPEECDTFYSFLQLFFYEIKLNKQQTRIYSIKNEILNLRLN